MEKRFLDIHECSKYMNISTSYLYQLVGTKQIPHTRIGRKILFDIKKIERFIDENSVEVQDWNERAMELRGEAKE